MKKIAVLAGLVVVVALSAPALAAEPTATTDAPVGVNSDSAVLQGRVTNADASTTSYFEYGLTVNYGSQVNTVKEGATTGVHAKITSLRPVTSYHYRLVVSKSGVLSYGADQTFQTKQVDTTDSSTGTGTGTGTGT